MMISDKEEIQLLRLFAESLSEALDKAHRDLAESEDECNEQVRIVIRLSRRYVRLLDIADRMAVALTEAAGDHQMIREYRQFVSSEDTPSP